MKFKQLIFPIVGVVLLFLAFSVALSTGSVKLAAVFGAATAIAAVASAVVFFALPLIREGRGAVTRGRLSVVLWCFFALFALLYIATYPEFNVGKDIRPPHYISELVCGCVFLAASVVLMLLFNKKRFWDMLYFPALGLTLVVEAVKELRFPAGTGYEVMTDIEKALFWVFAALLVVRIVTMIRDRASREEEAEAKK